MIRCGIVWPYFGTRIRLLRAFSTAFWIASGTSRALPYPIPTTESSSPTATRAVNEKRRPPFTTLATLLISITLSCRSSPLGETLSTAMERMRVEDAGNRPSELQAPLAGALGDGGDAPVEAVAGTVEDAGFDPGGLGSLGDQLPGALGLLHRVELAQLGLRPGDGRDRAAGVVVDQLGEDAPVRAVHGQPRALSVAADPRPDPPASTQPLLWLG